MYFFPPDEKLEFPIAHNRIREVSRPVMVSQFASDFDITKAMSDGNLDEDSFGHSGRYRGKASRNEEKRR
jgi:hypothetical protein